MAPIPQTMELKIPQETAATIADASAFLGFETTIESHMASYSHSMDQGLPFPESDLSPVLQRAISDKIEAESEEAPDEDNFLKRLARAADERSSG